MEKFITAEIDGKRISSFVTSNKPSCKNNEEHQWDGEEIMTFHNDERILKRSEFQALSDKEQDKLNVASGEGSCSKCGMGYMSYDNPYYSEV